MSNQTLEPHPLSLVMPDMTPAEFQQLLESIRTDGQLDEIVLFEGKILDGRNRYAACVNLGVAPVMREWDSTIDGDSPATFVMNKNVRRRHLSVSQRAMIAANIKPFFEAEAEARKKVVQFQPENTERGEVPEDQKGKAAEKAAAAMGVSPRSVETAAAVASVDPELAKEVTAGKTSLHAAAKKVAGKKAKAAPTIIPAENQRKAAHEKLVADHGQEFADAVLRGTLLPKAGDFEDFQTLDLETQNQIKELILARWTTKKAIRFMGQVVDSATKVGDLMLKLNASKKKSLNWTVGTFKITISRTE